MGEAKRRKSHRWRGDLSNGFSVPALWCWAHASRSQSPACSDFRSKVMESVTDNPHGGDDQLCMWSLFSNKNNWGTAFTAEWFEPHLDAFFADGASRQADPLTSAEYDQLREILSQQTDHSVMLEKALVDARELMSGVDPFDAVSLGAYMPQVAQILLSHRCDKLSGQSMGDGVSLAKLDPRRWSGGGNA